MASEAHMLGPECLIENINVWLLVNPEALKILSAIRQPIVVVAIVGLYCTGKSYLMNKLARKKKGEWHGQSPAKSLLSTHSPRVKHSDVRRGRERPGRDTESYLSVHSCVLIVITTCIRSQLFALCLSFFLKSTIFSFPRKKNVVIKNKRCM